MAMQRKTQQQAQTADAPMVVRVLGQGTLAGSGLPFLLVTSGSEPGRVHVVAYAYEGAFVGSRAQCDCIAASYGKSCKHVLVARAWLAGVASVSHVSRRTHTAQPKTPVAPDVQPQSMTNRTKPFSLLA